jgi:hypothetical protein
MGHRSLIVEDLLCPAYNEEGIDLTEDGRGRRIVGTLMDEMRQARAWVTQARSQFIEFFKWYYSHHPGEQVSAEMIAVYKRQARASLVVLDKVLPTLTRDCQALARVLDFAFENELYLYSEYLSDYRRQLVGALGPECDPAKLRLIHDERTLVNLIRELQNHVTPAQFARILGDLRGGFATAPWGDRQQVRLACQRWRPLSYGIYRIEGEEYRVVPHSRLRLETLDDWPSERVVRWRGGRLLGYKKSKPFQVDIGQRAVEAVPYVRSRHYRSYIWVGEAPIGQKFAIDGRLRSESAGAEWQIALLLAPGGSDRPSLCIAITRLMLYYPDLPHRTVRVWATTGYEYEDALHEDGVRRFHLHRRLVIPLDDFETLVEVGVSVSGDQVRYKSFEPETHYLFSVVSRGRVQARGVADLGDREYVLFTRSASRPQAGPGVSIEHLPDPFGPYAVYRVVWEEADRPFELQVGAVQWSFQRRREFAAMIDVRNVPPHLRLKPYQCLRFQDLELRLYSTVDLTMVALSMYVYGEEGLLGQVDLSPCVRPTGTACLFDIASDVWQEVEALAGGQPGKYVLRFCDGDVVLGEQVISLLPALELVGWDDQIQYLENEPLPVTVASTECPIWNPDAQQLDSQAVFWLHPRTQAEPWPEHPALRRIISLPISTLVSFPDLGETPEVVVHPWLFGFRLYLKRTEQPPGKSVYYQRLSQADYYHLSETALHIFAKPHCRVDLAVGAWVVWSMETDANGDLLIDSLDDLCQACLGEKTLVGVRCGAQQSSFVVCWAPLLQSLRVEEGEAIMSFNGPDDTFVRLRSLNLSGETYWSQDIPCEGKESISRVVLPAGRHALGYLVAEYVLPNGEVRPSVWQVQVGEPTMSQFPPEWLREGIGVESLRDAEMLA